MVFVTMLGGFGNQLSAYASAYTVAKYLNEPIILDISDYPAGYFRPYVLDQCQIPDHFKVYYPKTGYYYNSIYGAPDKFLSMLECVIDTDQLNFDREKLLDAVRGYHNIYMQGYGGWQFCNEEERQELKKLFQPRLKGNILGQFYKKIENQESVAVHIRRTDFVSLAWVVEDKQLNYYKAAIEFMRKELVQPQFYFFSDDIEWVKENLGNAKDYHYVTVIAGGGADVCEMYCISACRHRILTSRSSYGWWATCLSLHEDGINITNEWEPLPDINNRKILTSEEIELLSQKYKTVLTERRDLSEDLLLLENKIVENNNQEVIDYIDSLSFDAWDLTSKVKESLLEYRGIAYLQSLDQEGEALSIFDKLQQTRRDQYDFSFNYALALERAGRHFESLLYAANAVRLSEQSEIAQIIKSNGEAEKEAFQLVSRQKRKHFIFIDAFGCHNVNNFYQSLGIMMRNLGNKVSFLNLSSEKIEVKSCAIDHLMKVANQVLLEKQEDDVYQYGIDNYNVRILKFEDQYYSMVPFMIQSLYNGQEEMVVVAHSKEEMGYSQYIEGVDMVKPPIVYLDILSEWDVHKSMLNEHQKSDWDFIFAKAAKILTNQKVPEEYQHKVVRPFKEGCVQKGDDIIYVKDRVLFTDHYIRNEECLWGVVSLIKAAKDI